jgi:hypothetical protein
MKSRRFVLLCALFAGVASAQVIEFESSGLKYKALTHNGVTIMVATLHNHIREYAIFQVAISNGSPVSWGVRPEDFGFEAADGHMIRATPAKTVIAEMLDKASRTDVSKLITAYEAALFSNAQMHSTNGYEARRQDAMAELGSTRLKAAAATSAIALVTTKLQPGQSTDGAVFYPNGGRPMGAGKLLVNAAGELFEFPMEADPHKSH